MAVPSRKQAEQFFQTADKSGDGTASPSELIEFLETQFGVEHGDAIEMFNACDKNQDQSITLQEFLDEVLKEPRDKALRKAFQDIDQDGSGKIDHDECMRSGQESGLSDREVLEACWSAMDADGSGAVDKNEFINYMNNCY